MRLTKAEERRRRELVDRLDDLRTTLEVSLKALPHFLQQAVAPLNVAVALYNEAAAEAGAFVAGVAERAREEHDEKSDAWREGERGQALDALASEWEEAAYRLAPLPPVRVVLPELEDDAWREASATLDGLPGEPL